VELELWKFISFPVLERQFLLISAQLRPAELEQRLTKDRHCTHSIHTVFFNLSKKGVTMNRKIKNFVFAGLAATVLCAGTLSARQLSLAVQDTTCQHHFCTRTTPCPNVLGCGCVFNNPSATTGVCGFIAAKR